MVRDGVDGEQVAWMVGIVRESVLIVVREHRTLPRMARLGRTARSLPLTCVTLVLVMT